MDSAANRESIFHYFTIRERNVLHSGAHIAADRDPMAGADDDVPGGTDMMNILV